MNARRVGATVTATLLTLVTGFVSATSALAQLPPPNDGNVGPGNIPGAPTSGAPGTSHTLTYILVAVAAVALLAVIAMGVRFATRHPWHRSSPKVA